MVSEKRLSRRRLLQTTGATAGLLATGSLAGCGSIPFIGGGNSLSEWIPDPDEYDSEGTSFNALNYSKIAENEDFFDEDTFDSLESSGESTVEPLDIDYEDVTMAAQAGPASIWNGNYENQTVIEALEDEDTGQGEFEEDDTYEGYKVYILQEAADEPNIAYAVNGTTVVQTRRRGEENAVDMAEIMIDTKTGNGTRLVDEEEQFKTLLNEVGSGTIISGNFFPDSEVEDTNEDQGRFEGTIAQGSRLNINGETSDGKWVYVFDSEGDGDQGDLEDYATGSLDDQYNFNNDPSASAGGGVGTITGTFDTDEL